MVGGLPQPLDAFEARRLLLTLLVISAMANRDVAASTAIGDAPPRVGDVRPGTTRRRLVRPPRSC